MPRSVSMMLVSNSCAACQSCSRSIRRSWLHMPVYISSQYELSAGSENQFYLQAFDVEFTFYRNVRDEVDRMEVVLLGDEQEAKKIP